MDTWYIWSSRRTNKQFADRVGFPREAEVVVCQTVESLKSPIPGLDITFASLGSELYDVFANVQRAIRDKHDPVTKQGHVVAT